MGNQNHVITSEDIEKALDKIQHPFMIKTVTTVGKIPQHNKSHIYTNLQE